MPESELTPEAIAQAATEPASASSDGQAAAAVPIPDQIAADKYRRAAAAAEGRRSAWRSAVTGRVIPPGSA